jgi:hypothetical protein
MDSIIEYNNISSFFNNQENDIINDFKNKGDEIILKNSFFKDLIEIMSDNKVKNFFDKYFKTMDDIKTTVIYIKLFRLFQEKYNNLSHKELEDNINIYLLHHVMSNNELRKTMITSTIEHLEDNRKPILPINKMLLKNQKKKLKPLQFKY